MQSFGLSRDLKDCYKASRGANGTLMDKIRSLRAFQIGIMTLEVAQAYDIKTTDLGTLCGSVLNAKQPNRA